VFEKIKERLDKLEARIKNLEQGFDIYRDWLYSEIKKEMQAMVGQKVLVRQEKTEEKGIYEIEGVAIPVSDWEEQYLVIEFPSGERTYFNALTPFPKVNRSEDEENLVKYKVRIRVEWEKIEEGDKK